MSAPSATTHTPGAQACDEVARPALVRAALRRFGHRHRVPIMVAGSLVTAAVLALVLEGHRHEFATALSGTAIWVLAAAALLQLVAVIVRTEAWHLCIRA